MRNGVSRCARSHDATRQRDAVKRRCSGRGTLRQTPDPVSFPASFSACPPVRLQSMRFSGQLRSRSRQILCGAGRGAHPLPAGIPRTASPCSSVPCPSVPCPYSGIHTSADQQSLTVNTTRFSKAGPSPQRGGHRFAVCSAHRLFRHPDGPKRPGNAAVPRRGRFRQAFAQKKDLFLSRPACPGLLLPPSRGHARHRRSPHERFPRATGCSASRSVSSPGPFPHIFISRAVSSLLAPASPISPHFVSNATQPQTAGTAPGAARSRPPAGSSGPDPSPRLPCSESSLTVIDNHSQSVPNMPKGQRATCARPDAWERPAFCFRHPFRSLWPGSTPSPAAVRFGMTTLSGMDSHNLS